MTDTIVTDDRIVKVPRAELVAALRKRDGDTCQHPDCGRVIDFNAPEIVDGKSNPLANTIDHWYSQSFGKTNGWTVEKIWDLSNLKMMHKKCNAKKGDLIPNKDGTLPPKPQSTFRFRRQKRANRPEMCEDCHSGRLLGEGEWCNACGCGTNPGRFPKWRQMKVTECDHDLFYCVSCTIWFPEQRRSALDALLTGGEGYE